MTRTKTMRNWVFGSLLALSLLPAPAIAQAPAVVEGGGGGGAPPPPLPAPVRDSGVLRVATSLQWAPFAYMSEKNEPIGFDLDLMRLISAKLGLKFELEDMKFPTIVPGVASGRYQAGVNQLSLTPERLNAADMIPYFDTTSVIIVQKGRTVKDIANLCGMTFVVTQGSVQVRQLNHLSEVCVAKGAKPITQQLYPSSAETLLAVSNGRGDAFLTAAPQGVYISRVNPKIDLIPGDVPDVPRSPAGIVIEKGNVAMGKAISLALLSAMEDGSYQKLLDQYGVSSSGVSPDLVRKHAQ